MSYRKLTRRETILGTLVVGIIATGAMGGASLREDHQARKAKRDFVQLPATEQISRLESLKEGLLKRQMTIERKLELSREQRAFKAKGLEIRTGAEGQKTTGRGELHLGGTTRRKDEATSALENNTEKPHPQEVTSERSWKSWLGLP